MKKTKIKVGDKEFPCRVTMGAMVRFKNESGKDVSKLEKTISPSWYCLFTAA